MNEAKGRRGPTLKTIQRVIAKDCTLSQYGRLVAIALAERVNKQGEAWPSLGYLMACTRMRRSTVVRAINEITECERPLFYKSWARSKAAKRKSLTYVFVDSPKALEHARASCSGGATNPARKYQRAHPEHGNGKMLTENTDDAHREHEACPVGARGVLTRSNNPLSESQIESEREPPRARERAGAASPLIGNPEPDTEETRAAIVGLAKVADRRTRRKDASEFRKLGTDAIERIKANLKPQVTP